MTPEIPTVQALGSKNTTQNVSGFMQASVLQLIADWGSSGVQVSFCWTEYVLKYVFVDLTLTKS